MHSETHDLWPIVQTSSVQDDKSILSSVFLLLQNGCQEIELRPRTAITFAFRGSSPTVGRLSESLYCEAKVGKEKQTRQVFKASVRNVFTTAWPRCRQQHLKTGVRLQAGGCRANDEQ